MSDGGEEKRVHGRVEGRVQGVGFRAATQAAARRLGLTGWVRNLPDGAVELESQGPAAAVDDLVTWCAHGPDGARVTAARFAAQPLEPATGCGGFAIQR